MPRKPKRAGAPKKEKPPATIPFDIPPHVPSPDYHKLMLVLHQVHRCIPSVLSDHERFSSLPHSALFRFRLNLKEACPPMFGQLYDALEFDAFGWCGESPEDQWKTLGPEEEDFEEILEEITMNTVEDNFRKIERRNREIKENNGVPLDPPEVPPKRVPGNVCEMCGAIRKDVLIVPYPLVIISGEVIRGTWDIDTAKQLYLATMARPKKLWVSGDFWDREKMYLQVCPEHIDDYVDEERDSRLDIYEAVVDYLENPLTKGPSFANRCQFFDYWLQYNDILREDGPFETKAQRLLDLGKELEKLF